MIFDFGIIGKVLVAIVIVGGLSIGVFALINTPKNDETVKDTSDNNAEQNTDYAGLAACLNTAYKNHNLISGKLYTKNMSGQ